MGCGQGSCSKSEEREAQAINSSGRLPNAAATETANSKDDATLEQSASPQAVSKHRVAYLPVKLDANPVTVLRHEQMKMMDYWGLIDLPEIVNVSKLDVVLHFHSPTQRDDVKLKMVVKAGESVFFRTSQAGTRGTHLFVNSGQSTWVAGQRDDFHYRNYAVCPSGKYYIKAYPCPSLDLTEEARKAREEDTRFVDEFERWEKTTDGFLSRFEPETLENGARRDSIKKRRTQELFRSIEETEAQSSEEYAFLVDGSDLKCHKTKGAKDPAPLRVPKEPEPLTGCAAVLAAILKHLQPPEQTMVREMQMFGQRDKSTVIGTAEKGVPYFMSCCTGMPLFISLRGKRTVMVHSALDMEWKPPDV